MLNNVPNAVNTVTRNVVMNHPNTFNCEVYRKTVLRTESPETTEAPTLGGLGVMDSGDEDDFEYQFLGYGHALPAEAFTVAPMVKHGDANIGGVNEYRYLIEPEEPSGSPGYFDVRNHDVIYLLLGTGETPPKIAYEVVGTETTSNIPPYTQRFVCNRRDDLDLLTPADYDDPGGSEDPDEE